MALTFDLTLDGPVFAPRKHEGFSVYFKRIDSLEHSKWVKTHSNLTPANYDLKDQNNPVLKFESLTAEQKEWLFNQHTQFCAEKCTKVEGVDVDWDSLTLDQKILFFEQLEAQIPEFKPWMTSYIQGGEKKSARMAKGKGSEVLPE